MRHTIDHLLIGDRLTRLMAERGLCAADVARMLDGGKGEHFRGVFAVHVRTDACAR